MIALVQDKREQLAGLCREFGVARLEVFGSAATGEFDPETSDLDFLVLFHDLPAGEHAHRFFGLLDALRELFGRPVDLVDPRPLRNPYLIADINRSRELLYAA